MDEETDVEFLRTLAQHGDDNPYDGTIGVDDRARLRSIAAKLEVLERHPHTARMIQAEASGKVPDPSDVAEVCSYEIAVRSMKAVAKRVGLPEDSYWPDIMAKLKRLVVEIDVLRTYGNNDCTAMADERMERIWSGEEPWG